MADGITKKNVKDSFYDNKYCKYENGFRLTEYDFWRKKSKNDKKRLDFFVEI